MEMPSVKEQVALLPEKPGVYRYYDRDGLLLYIGKAKNYIGKPFSYMGKAKNYMGKAFSYIGKAKSGSMKISV